MSHQDIVRMINICSHIEQLRQESIMTAKAELVTSFIKGLHVLRSFGQGRRRQTITDVAKNTDMTRAAARRFLLTLCEEGLARTDGKHFELTPTVLEIGNAYLSGVTELERVREILQDLTIAVGESASAAVIDGTDIIYIARSQARHRVMSIGLAIGSRLPAHATSLGQAILAQYSQNEIDRYFANADFKALTPYTITTREALRERLKQVRAQGYALVSEELEIGLRSISIAIPGRTPHTRLAINMSAQVSRISQDDMRAQFVPALHHAARQIELGMMR
jgi:IclR family transcriptional regulator, pca regulon regulatory protein